MCDESAFHVVSMVRGRPPAAHFSLHPSWPIPWKEVLAPEDRHLANLMCQYCVGFARICARRSRYIHGYEWWFLHCHCDKPRSLQCRSSSVLFQNLLKHCVQGTSFDKKFWFYRRELSKLSSLFLYYVGSVHVNGVHLIYFSGCMRINSRPFIRAMNWGEALWYESSDTQFLILICRSCNPLDEIRINCCLRRSRARMIEFLRLLPDYCKNNVGLYTKCDRYLEKLARTEEPVLCTRFKAAVKKYP